MRNVFTNTAISIITAFVFAASGSLAQQAPAGSELHAMEQQVLAVEEEYVVAEVSRDEETLRRIIDDRFVQNSSDGTTSGKEELIQSILKLRLLGRSVRERTVLMEGDLALVFGTADLRFGGPGQQERVSMHRYTSAYVKREDQWRLLALQMQQYSGASETGNEVIDADNIEN